MAEADLGGDRREHRDVEGHGKPAVRQLGLEERLQPLEVLAGGRQRRDDREQLLEGEGELLGHPHLACVGFRLPLDGLRGPQHPHALAVRGKREGGREVLVEADVLGGGLRQARGVGPFGHGFRGL